MPEGESKPIRISEEAYEVLRAWAFHERKPQSELASMAINRMAASAATGRRLTKERRDRDEEEQNRQVVDGDGMES